jgi:hypothetical protein
MPALSTCLPGPYLGVVVVVIVLACTVVLVTTGADLAAATAAVVTLSLAGIDMSRRLLQAPTGTDLSPRG